LSWFELLKSKYHVTSKDNIENIMREGLKPSAGGSLLRNSVWTFNNYEDALRYSQSKSNPVIFEIEPNEHIKFKRGPDELVGTGGKSGMPGTLLETSITTQPITGDFKVMYP